LSSQGDILVLWQRAFDLSSPYKPLVVGSSPTRTTCGPVAQLVEHRNLGLTLFVVIFFVIMNKQEFQKKLTETIERLDMSHDDVCKKLKLSQTTLKNWLDGDDVPHINGRIVIIEMLKRRIT